MPSGATGHQGIYQERITNPDLWRKTDKIMPLGREKAPLLSPTIDAARLENEAEAAFKSP